MEDPKVLNINFYRNLGKLFYAIAAIDNTVHETEFNALKKIIEDKWIAFDDIIDSYGTDTAHQIEIVFDWLNSDEENSANDCFEAFVNFKKKNAHLFDAKTNALIMETANSIAASFSGKNKSELILLAKLKLELNKT